MLSFKEDSLSAVWLDLVYRLDLRSTMDVDFKTEKEGPALWNSHVECAVVTRNYITTIDAIM